MKAQTRQATLIAITVASLLAFNTNLFCQVKGTLFQRVSKVSNFEFAIDNDGTLWGKNYLGLQNGFAPVVGFWPRNSFHMQPIMGGGLMFLAKKSGRYLSSDAGYFMPKAKMMYGVSENDPFNHMVPGRIGDEKAGFDSVFNGKGWRYIDDPDYIVYSSLDYDKNGVDITGTNYNDWPIRMVNGNERYVALPLERNKYPPVYHSDEDMFCVFKDTDTRVDEYYSGPNGWSVPIGVEVRNYVYTWKEGVGKNIVVLRYEVVNKSDTRLDSCFVVFGSGLRICDPNGIAPSVFTWSTRLEPWRNLIYNEPDHLDAWKHYWKATDRPPVVGIPFLETPSGYENKPLGLTYGLADGDFNEYIAPDSSRKLISEISDSLVYRTITTPKWWWLTNYNDPHIAPNRGNTPVLISGPFPIQPNDATCFAVAFIFADSLPHLLLMDDYIQKVYNNNFQRPSPPPSPKLTAAGLNRSVKLLWDNSAESATDIIVPDSLGKPFAGYRLLRAEKKDGPFKEIGRWTRDSLVHEYLDRGTEIGGLKNNVRYYYRLFSFDEGAKLLKLDTMESPPVEGVNSISVVPSTEPSNASSSESGGNLLSGTMGNVAPPTLVPTNPTNFNNLISGRELKVTINAATDGTRYTLPVSIRDTVSGRLHNALVDINLQVHGNAQIAGIKEGKAVIKDIFGIGAADVTMDYRFEQLNEPFQMTASIESSNGADVPIIIDDSLKVTGVLNITPYTTAAKEVTVEFTAGGADTGATFPSLRIFQYLNVKVTDVSTGIEYQPTIDYEIRTTGVRPSNTQLYTAKMNRYYLTGTLPNNEYWEFGSKMKVYESQLGFDYPDRGVGSGKTGTLFSWASGHRAGTKDFQAGDKIRIKWQGGVKAVFPQNAQLAITGAAASRVKVTDEMMEKIRIVPNPYVVRHEAQRGVSVLYFNYLPEECSIKIYTIALDLIKTIQHSGGSREEWNLQTEGGQSVASQMLYAIIETAEGKKTVKKFSVVLGK